MPMPANDAVSFPDVASAAEDGLLLMGGQLTEPWILEAYRRGIFPWPIVDETEMLLAWFSPDPRAILELDGLHISRRLARRIRSDQFRVTCNCDFTSVLAGCAEPRRDDELTWITDELARAYLRLHRRGFAHSIEVWQDDQLVGGLYGVVQGGVFFGESMFSRQRDASKVALAHLVTRLRDRGFALLDIQQATPHLTRMGATEISRHDYLQRLAAGLRKQVQFHG
ncbi:MAG: leucyl/phenylalanyl-tRNA--protein transferase [Pirellulaceae bacterium]|nr:leucyl/phenylalanyl-tRNA--protein transferase [Pirellulaceae bacterium]MDP6719183.1 leucyl/phenylalanyl-tRNA--protein transferase [Pirellulaceae bacterium]